MPLLELRDESAGYDDGRLILREVSLTIEAGERIALVGESGGREIHPAPSFVQQAG